MNKNHILFARLTFGVGLFLFGSCVLGGTFVGMFLLWIITGIVAFMIFTKSVPFMRWNLAKTALLTVFVVFGLFSLFMIALIDYDKINLNNPSTGE